MDRIEARWDKMNKAKAVAAEAIREVNPQASELLTKARLAEGSTSGRPTKLLLTYPMADGAIPQAQGPDYSVGHLDRNTVKTLSKLLQDWAVKCAGG
jgi:hypothetical protein